MIRPDVHVTAFVTPAMVQCTAARAVQLNQDVGVAVMNGQQIALADDAFDAVLLHLILAVIPDPVACAREAARVLRPDGRVAIFDRVEVKAGLLTPFIWAYASLFYHYRQHRWRRLVEGGFAYPGEATEST